MLEAIRLASDACLRGSKRLAQILFALLLVMLICHPTLHVLAPLVDLVGTIGLDGVLLIVEAQFLAWSLPLFRRYATPVFTRCWNRYIEPRLGSSPGETSFSDVVLYFFHFLLCRGGKTGLLIYLAYIALICHFAPHAPVIVT
jgi:hypothetical protein